MNAIAWMCLVVFLLSGIYSYFSNKALNKMREQKYLPTCKVYASVNSRFQFGLAVCIVSLIIFVLIIL